MKDKKIIVSTIIGIGVLVLLVVGATFAYFVVPVKNNFTKTNASSKIDSIGTVTLSPGSDISMEITSGQMMQMDTDVAYYGSSEGTTEEETSEIIATASVSGNGVFNCTYDLVMNATGTNNMYDAVQGMSDKEGQLILTVNGVRYDFSTTNLFPKTISGEMLGLTEGVNQELTAQLKLINKTGTEQNALIGTDINITFELQNFECSAVDMGSSGSYVMETSPANISEELVNGLYRYQGTNTEVTNNYLCFGTTDKDTCLNPDNGALFRIIGITPDGQLKIIYSYNTGDLTYHDNSLINVSWPDSDLYKALNTTISSHVPPEWLNILLQKEWEYGTISGEDTDKLTGTSKEKYNSIVALENAQNNKYQSVFGLLNFGDIVSHVKLSTDTIIGEVDGWLNKKTVNSNFYGAEEWLLTKYGLDNSEYAAWTFHSDGISYESLNSGNLARPVVYLKSDLTLSGSGTIDNPYMISI